jgi:SAM-dependent methyltransferase
MTETYSLRSQYEADVAQTLQNRAALDRNPNLLYWYEQLYREQFRDLCDPAHLRILEIGSGVSPLRRFYPEVTTSDILELDYLDHVFDCHKIDQVAALPDESFDVITLTNVLHHLHRPLEFLQRAANKLKHSGKLVATEPYFSLISTPIFKYLHHEAVNLSISKPELDEIAGPLSSANIALPWLMFVEHPSWVESLRAHYQFDERSLKPFSSLSYMATGGISHRIPLPGPIYQFLFHLDLIVSRTLPQLSASFFTISLTRK